MRIIFGILLTTTFLAITGCASDEAFKQFGNRTYFFADESDTQIATLVNGFFQDANLGVCYDNKYVYGDFNHDGLKDAAVIISENTGGNADLYELAFLINDGTKLVHKASLSLDVWAEVNSVTEKDGKVIVDMYVHQEGDCNAGPTKRVRNVYEYPGPDPELERIYQQTLGKIG
ncbi:MAG: hypothetical protein WCH62_04940 [Candidatus Omnitrophota bacterium]